jgi:hypothetical protein
VGTALAELLSFAGLGNENLRPFVDERTAVNVVAWIAKKNPNLEDVRATLPDSAKIRFAR